MTMIEERYVSFEVARLLDTKDFDGLCKCYYSFNKKHSQLRHSNLRISKKDCCEDEVLCPTQQMAMKWLRKKGIFIAINNDDLDYNWQCYDLINKGSTKDPKILSSSYAGYKTYEEAVDAALKYSLENLI